MADLNALIAQGAQFQAPLNPFTQYAQMQQLQHGQTANALAQYQLAQAQRADQEANALRQSLPANFDISNPEHVNAVLRASPVGGAALIKSLAGTQAEAVKTQRDQAALIKEHIDNSKATLASVVDQPGYTAWRDYTVKNLPQLAASIPEQFTPDVKNTLLIKADDISKQLTLPLHFGTTGGMTNVGFNPVTGAQVTQGVAATVTPGELLAHQDRVKRLEQDMATGVLTPDSIDFAAQMYAQTGQLPSMGLGKNAANMRAQVMNRAAQIATGGGADTAEQGAAKVISNKMDVAGRSASARTIGTTGAAMTLGANEAQQMIPIAQAYVAKLNPSDYPTLNSAGLFIAKNTGDPTQAGLAASLNALVNSYSRAISPRGVPTVSDKNHAREIIASNMSKGQFAEVFNVMQQEMQAAQKSLTEVRPGTIGKQTPAAPVESNIDALLNKYK